MASMSQLTMAMITLYSGDPKRIQHFMKVYAFAKMIAEEEQIGAKQREVIEAAALVHDIGIHAAEKKYRSAAGEYQEQEGPPIARAMLMALEFSPALTNRVCELVAHHHSYQNIDAVDLQILVEADFLVNLYEDGRPDGDGGFMPDKAAVETAYQRIFATETGKWICRSMFALGGVS